MEVNPKFKVGFTQSVSSGIIGFHAEVETNNIEDIKELSKVLSLVETNFKNKGYLIASDIKPKEEKSNGKNGSNGKK